MKLSVYNYPCTLDAGLDDIDALFPIGTIFAVREPYYKTTADGKGRLLRVDSPSDLVFIDADNELTRNIKWSTGMKVAGSPRLPNSADNWKERGVSEFKSNRWLAAAICFSEALDIDPGHLLSRLNRAEAYLRLEWFNSALHDCEEVLKGNLTDDSLHRKAVFRAAKASYYSGEYEKAIEVAALRPSDLECKSWSNKANRRIQERSIGNYDWCSLFQQAQKEATRVDAAEFIGPLEVRKLNKQGRIRGTYATRDIAVGDLLVSSSPCFRLRLLANLAVGGREAAGVRLSRG